MYCKLWRKYSKCKQLIFNVFVCTFICQTMSESMWHTSKDVCVYYAEKCIYLSDSPSGLGAWLEHLFVHSPQLMSHCRAWLNKNRMSGGTKHKYDQGRCNTSPRLDWRLITSFTSKWRAQSFADFENENSRFYRGPADLDWNGRDWQSRAVGRCPMVRRVPNLERWQSVWALFAQHN